MKEEKILSNEEEPLKDALQELENGDEWGLRYGDELVSNDPRDVEEVADLEVHVECPVIDRAFAERKIRAMEQEEFDGTASKEAF
ncbi:hypothetical protein SUGI_0453620 [Cryptomeria japonica]|nr:hypothetical protein SUGI_0453620 [Cryptomeria japonica]